MQARNTLNVVTMELTPETIAGLTEIVKLFFYAGGGAGVLRIAISFHKFVVQAVERLDAMAKAIEKSSDTQMATAIAVAAIKAKVGA